MATTKFNANAAYDIYKNNVAPASAGRAPVRRMPRPSSNENTRSNAAPARKTAPSPVKTPAPRPAAVRPKPVAVPEKRVSSEQLIDEFVRRVKKTVKIFIGCALTFLMAGMLIHQNAQLIELNKEYVKYQQQLERAQSKNVSLESQFNALISIDKVEDYAKNKLGMVKRQSYQVKSFRVEGEDEVVLVNGAPAQESEDTTN